MKPSLPFVVVVTLLLFSAVSCRTPKTVPPQVIVKDSIQIVIKDRIVHDTVPFYVPAESSSSITPDDSSHLETNFAVSDAWLKNGLLYHMLKNKEQQIVIPHDVIVTDTTTTHSSETTITPPPEPIYIEKELSWWQQVCIKYFPWALVALLLCLIWIFRNPIINLIKKFI